eukprot:TRINITY_DN8483_c1_g1_i1.p2 TRINITY_DN8483_c1_g1~~TRINITY_DN8483_c1_g1_i1.p2  ORF type:complete len:467 (+),score=98.75 TRINITY_DN8483_c1_g1_i1:25-1401(+)
METVGATPGRLPTVVLPTPSHPSSLKELQETVQRLNKENFGLKMRIFYLQERLAVESPGEAALLQETVEQKALLEETFRELEHKTELLIQTRDYIQTLEQQQDSQSVLFPDLSIHDAGDEELHKHATLEEHNMQQLRDLEAMQDQTEALRASLDKSKRKRKQQKEYITSLLLQLNDYNSQVAAMGQEANVTASQRQSDADIMQEMKDTIEHQAATIASLQHPVQDTESSARLQALEQQHFHMTSQYKQLGTDYQDAHRQLRAYSVRNEQLASALASCEHEVQEQEKQRESQKEEVERAADTKWRKVIAQYEVQNETLRVELRRAMAQFEKREQLLTELQHKQPVFHNHIPRLEATPAGKHAERENAQSMELEERLREAQLRIAHLAENNRVLILELEEKRRLIQKINQVYLDVKNYAHSLLASSATHHPAVVASRPPASTNTPSRMPPLPTHYSMHHH